MDDSKIVSMRGTDLHPLRCFLAVAETLHFGRAAAALDMTQPPLSVQVRRLEDAVGARLLERGPGGVSLTAAGVVLRDEARALLARHAQAIENTRAAARGEAGGLRLGFVTPVEYSFLPAVLREFRAAMPGVRLVLQEMTSDAQVAALREGGLDAGLLLPPVPRALARRTVHHEPLVVALPARHPQAKGRGPLALSALAGMPLVIFPRDKAPGLHDDITALLARAGLVPEIGQEAIQMQTILSLVAAGLGFAVVPDSLRAARRAGVAFRVPAGRVPRMRIALAWDARRVSPVLRAFLAHLPEAAAGD